ncbi:MAG: response regulator transcription factor [Ruminococcus sp.]|nr:response regulator transcription factor [Ruminococcus sp.]
MNILLVEDNKAISKGLVYTLSSNGYNTTVCDTYETALSKSGEEFDLIIIDITLPDGNGFELFKDIRRYNNAPVVFLTALDDEDNIVKGLDLGADDYITKPFSTRELLARIRRLTRKNENKQNTVTTGDIILDLDSKSVSKNGKTVELTALEYRIFSMLMQNLGKTVTRASMLDKIWDIAGNFVNDNTLTVYIKRIRTKLDTDLIKTVKGVGYRMEKK